MLDYWYWKCPKFRQSYTYYTVHFSMSLTKNENLIMHGNMRQAIQPTVDNAEKSGIFCTQITPYRKFHLAQIKWHMIFWTYSSAWLFTYVEKQRYWGYVKFQVLIFRIWHHVVTEEFCFSIGRKWTPQFFWRVVKIVKLLMNDINHIFHTKLIQSRH